MSHSVHVVGFKPYDDTWHKMKAVYDTCIIAGIDVPDEVQQYFNYSKPDLAGVEVRQEQLEDVGAIVLHKADMQYGYDVYIDKLPKGVKIVRVYDSY